MNTAVCKTISSVLTLLVVSNLSVVPAHALLEVSVSAVLTSPADGAELFPDKEYRPDPVNQPNTVYYFAEYRPAGYHKIDIKAGAGDILEIKWRFETGISDGSSGFPSVSGYGNPPRLNTFWYVERTDTVTIDSTGNYVFIETDVVGGFPNNGAPGSVYNGSYGHAYAYSYGDVINLSTGEASGPIEIRDYNQFRAIYRQSANSSVQAGSSLASFTSMVGSPSKSLTTPISDAANKFVTKMIA